MQDNTAKVWSTYDGRFWALDLTLNGHQGSVRGATFNEDASRAVTVSKARLPLSVAPHLTTAYSCVWSYLFSWVSLIAKSSVPCRNQDGTVRFWDSSEGTEEGICSHDTCWFSLCAPPREPKGLQFVRITGHEVAALLAGEAADTPVVTAPVPHDAPVRTRLRKGRTEDAGGPINLFLAEIPCMMKRGNCMHTLEPSTFEALQEEIAGGWLCDVCCKDLNPNKGGDNVLRCSNKLPAQFFRDAIRDGIDDDYVRERYFRHSYTHRSDGQSQCDFVLCVTCAAVRTRLSRMSFLAFSAIQFIEPHG